MKIHMQRHNTVRKLLIAGRFSAQILPAVVPKIASMAILAALLATAWVAFTFVRVSLAESATPAPAASQARPAARTAEPLAGAVATTLGKREPLVYLTEGDAATYHLCSHNPTGAPRQAVPVAMARSRGYAACGSCFRQPKR